ncbi:GAF domain-containing protein [Pseudomarimonas arenosa]|uniref:GAF domain-containing protein n=1 Tax=Pseudomarimonas arenosa TaxID=2774145 RepID=A0AAW3ZUK3_9GAMM|nr:GAF domain-containing protein [Pseudomarimonas arenosa]MBD8528119.1 GAF domain-containing protein [Pseudomarimonas arenosa]
MDAESTQPCPAGRFLAAPDAELAGLEQALRGCNTPAEAAWRLAEAAGRLLELSDCVVYLRPRAQGALVQVAAWGSKQVAIGILENPIRLPIGLGIVGACARDRVPVLVADTLLDYRYVPDVDNSRSELAIPLIRRGQLVGVLDSEHNEPDYYNSLHIRALLKLAEVFVECEAVGYLAEV